MRSRAGVKSLLNEKQIGLFKPGPYPIGKTVTQPEDSENAIGFFQFMLIISKPKAVVLEVVVKFPCGTFAGQVR
jgi:hypothetical protein